jgi:hypothetical protein
MKITFIHPDLGLGGAERLIVDAACALLQAGHDVHILTAHHDAARSFDETNTVLAGRVHVKGDWIPRSVLSGKFHLVFAFLRTLVAGLQLLYLPALAPDAVGLGRKPRRTSTDAWERVGRACSSTAGGPYVRLGSAAACRRR